MMDLRLHHEEPTLAIGQWRRVLLTRFVGAPGVDQLQRVRDVQREMVAKTGKVAMFTIVEPRSGLNFDDKARRRSSALQAEMRNDIIVGTQVVMKSGFFGSIVRSIMFGVNALGKPPYPTRVCSSLEEAAEFIASELVRHGEDVTPAILLEAARDFLSRIHPSTAEAEPI